MTFDGVEIPLDLHLDILALCVGLLVAYVGLIRRHVPARATPGARAVSPGQVAAFTMGVFALWVASGSPVHDLAERSLYSVHMVQHLLHAFVVPPLLLLGTPAWMFEVVLRPRWLRGVVRTAARPVLAGVAFNAVLLLIHWPAVVDAMVRSEFLHGVSHVAVLAAATFMWMNVFSPASHVVPRLAPMPQLFFLFLMTLLPTIPSGFLTFGESPLYGVYTALPRPGGLSVIEDMRIAGLLMKIGGGFLLWGVITVLYFRWASSEDAPDGPAPTPAPTANLPTSRS